MEYRDMVGKMECTDVSRFNSTPEPYMLCIRDEYDDGGIFVKEVSRKRVYSNILGGWRIVEEPIE